jgi:hypothetical protein
MSLADEIAAAGRKNPRCAVGKLLAGLGALEGDDIADLRTALTDTATSARVIALALQGREIHIAHDAIYRHREGVCACRKLGIV